MIGLKIQVSITMESASRTIWPVPDISRYGGRDGARSWREERSKGARERGSAGKRDRGGGRRERDRERESRERERVEINGLLCSLHRLLGRDWQF